MATQVQQHSELQIAADCSMRSDRHDDERVIQMQHDENDPEPAAEPPRMQRQPARQLLLQQQSGAGEKLDLLVAASHPRDERDEGHRNAGGAAEAGGAAGCSTAPSQDLRLHRASVLQVTRPRRQYISIFEEGWSPRRSTTWGGWGSSGSVLGDARRASL